MPRILGLGLVALDLIVEHYDDHRRVLLGGGGTCANVLAILACSGWEASLAGALDESAWSELMRQDLEHAGVETKGVRRQVGATPSLIVEHLARTGDAKGQHWFQPYGSGEGDWPGLYAAPDNAVQGAAPSLPGQDVLFVDRLSAEVLQLARRAKAQGTVVVYEPSTRQDRPWVSEMLGLADVVKYSSERAGAIGLAAADVETKLVLVTDGPRGVAWRLGGSAGDWLHQAAVRSPSIVDTCGAGDWFTAGLLMGLYGGPSGRQGAAVAPERVANAVKGAAVLAAWSCGFVGARGALYDAQAPELKSRIDCASPAKNRSRRKPSRPAVPAVYREEVLSLCRG